jgi:hypothetical protein
MNSVLASCRTHGCTNDNCNYKGMMDGSSTPLWNTFLWMLWREAICWHIFHLAKPSMYVESWNGPYTTSKQSQVFACVNAKSPILIHTWADGFVKFLFMLERGVSLLHSHVGLPLGAPLAGDYFSIEPPHPPGSNHPHLCSLHLMSMAHDLKLF